MIVPDRVRLLHGPYQPPRLYVGDRATCLYRDCDVVVTSWTDAPISWPRCRHLTGKSHPSLLVNDELARAGWMESAAAVGYWWGVSPGVVWRWRKALGVGENNNPGSRRLRRMAAKMGGAAQREAAQTKRKRFGALASGTVERRC